MKFALVFSILVLTACVERSKIDPDYAARQQSYGVYMDNQNGYTPCEQQDDSKW